MPKNRYTKKVKTFLPNQSKQKKPRNPNTTKDQKAIPAASKEYESQA